MLLYLYIILIIKSQRDLITAGNKGYNYDIKAYNWKINVRKGLFLMEFFLFLIS